MNDPMQHTQVVVATTVAAAAGIMGLLALLSAAIRRWRAAAGAATVTAAIAAAGLAAYRPVLGQWPTTSLQSDVIQRLLWATAGAAVLLIGEQFVIAKLRPAVRRLVAMVTAIVFPTAVLVYAFWPLPSPDPAVSQAMFLQQTLWVPIACVVGGWLLLEPIAVRSPGAAVPLVTGFLAAGIGMLILLTSSTAPAMSVAPVGGTVAGVLVAAWVAALLRRRRVKLTVSSADGPVLVWLTLLVGLIAYAHLDTLELGEIANRHLLLIGAAAPLAWIVEIPAVHRWKPLWRELLRAILVATPVVTAVALAYHQHAVEAAANGGY